MEEYFDVLDIDGNPTGEKKLRNLVHRDGDWHRSVHVWILNGDKLLFQKRAPQKDSHPNEWDISCAGHVSAGETSLEAAKKELEEELGFVAREEDLIKIFSMHDSDVQYDGKFISNEIADIYLVQSKQKIESFSLQVEEVTELKWMPLEEVERLVSEQPLGYVPNWEEMAKLLDYLKTSDLV